MGRSANNSGVSLVEVIMAVVVLGIAIPPVASMFSEVAHHSPDDVYQGAAIHAANSLMEEIVSKAFEDPDLAPGSFGTEELSRRDFDDIDDFDGLTTVPDLVNTDLGIVDAVAVSTDSGLTETLADATPSTVPDTTSSPHGGIDLMVVVENVLPSDTDPAVAQADGSTDWKRITVSASWSVGDGGEVRFKTLRTKIPATTSQSGYLDESGIAGSASVTADIWVELVLINKGNDPLEVVAAKIEADRATPPLTRISTTTNFSWMQASWGGSSNLPTTDLPLTWVAADRRTIPAKGYMEIRFSFMRPLATGPINFTMTYTFANGEQETLTVPVEWI